MVEALDEEGEDQGHNSTPSHSEKNSANHAQDIVSDFRNTAQPDCESVVSLPLAKFLNTFCYEEA